MERNQILDKSGKVVSFIPTKSKVLTDATDHSDTTGFMLHVGTGGTLVVDLLDDVDSTQTTFTIGDNSWFPCLVKKLYSTSTATGVVKLN